MNCDRSSAGVILATICATLAASVPARALPIQTDPLEDLIQGLALTAHPPGKKDTARAMGPMRVGWSLWETGEGKGGYTNYIAGMKFTPPTSDAYVAALTIKELVGMSEGTLLTPAQIGSTIYDLVYENPHAAFSFPGPGSDFEKAFLAYPELDFLVAQGVVMAPVPMGGTYTFYRYPRWASLAGSAAASGLRLVQNIGFSNHLFITSNEFQFNRNYPLVLKPVLGVYGQPLVHVSPLGGVTANLLIPTDVWARYPMANVAHPFVAGLVRQSIVAQATKFPAGGAVDQALDYTIAGGEFFLGISHETGIGIIGENLIEYCPTLGSFEDYLNCLPITDYSTHSVAHFRRWLERRYTFDISKLNGAWGTGLASFDVVDPLFTGQPTGGLHFPVILGDWRDFQRDQWLVAAHNDQYYAAKKARPSNDMFRLSFNGTGAEMGSFYNDGAALADFYQTLVPDNGPAQALVHTKVKRAALGSLTYGEPVTFPLFGMVRSSAPGYSSVPGPCWAPGETIPDKEDIPASYEPPCYNQKLAYRTVREMLALGTDSLGVAYWEVAGHWSNKQADFVEEFDPSVPIPVHSPLPVAMARDVVKHQDERAFMSPWLSPALVHVGEAPVPNEYPTNPSAVSLPYRALDTLFADHAQVAPVVRTLAFDDLWAPRTRTLLLSSFVPGLDGVLLDRYDAAANEHGWKNILILARQEELELGFGPGWIASLANDHCLQFSALVGDLALFNDLANSSCTPTCRVDLVVFQKTVPPLTDGQILAYLPGQLAPNLDAIVASAGRTLLPIGVSVTGGTAKVDVNVMSDGMNFLVSLANTNAGNDPTPLTVTLTVDAAAPQGASYGSVAPITLAGGDSAIAYIPATFPGIPVPSPSELQAKVDDERAFITTLDGLLYDVRAAKVVLDRMDEMLASPSTLLTEKVVAGLAHVRRMVFARSGVGPTGRFVEAVDWKNTALAGVLVQAEHCLQDRHRVDAAPTAGDGKSSVSTAPVAGAETWDPVLQQYVLPGALTNVVEFGVHRPDTHGHARLIVVGP